MTTRRHQLLNVASIVLVGLVAVALATLYTDHQRLSDLIARGGGRQHWPLPDYASSVDDSFSSRPPMRTVVGPRTDGARYGGCTSTEFLDTVARLRVKNGGLAQDPPDNNTFEISDFDYSFDWPDGTCPRPHIFKSDDACDLVEAFGGLYMRGDSLTRHLSNALFMILRDRPDGAVYAQQDHCTGDTMFVEKGCWGSGIRDSQQTRLPLPEPICSGKTWIFYEGMACPVAPSRYVPTYLDWRSRLNSNASALSTVVIQNFGLHCKMWSWMPLLGAFKPLLAHAQSAYPRPLLMWTGVHAPGKLKPKQYLEEQGSERIIMYNNEIRHVLSTLQPASAEAVDGVFSFFDTYGMTFGANSHDGTHYQWQVNIEKAQLFLNWLDLVWSEAKDLGGLWDLSLLCVPGRESHQCKNMD
ncbi:hypothetical protein OIO90_005475 [Microbotryomycetes sp. JL221]|nr:hypothetical protein OIO90_005475 [Microbotryomycetes sp. JL221]